MSKKQTFLDMSNYLNYEKIKDLESLVINREAIFSV